MKYDEYLEFISTQVNESGAHTFTEKAINTPTGRSSNLIMCIWGLQYNRTGSLIHGAENDGVKIMLASTSQSAMLDISNPNCMWVCDLLTYWGSSASFQIVDRHEHIWFPLPIMYAKSQIYLSILGSANQTATQNCHMKILYTIRKVSLFKMVEALVE